MVANKFAPTIAQVLDCVTREPYLHVEEANHHIFEYYWDVLLPKVLGKEHWDKSHRHYLTISEAEHEDRKVNKEMVNPGTEAFLYLLFENAYHKWTYLAACRKEGNEPDSKNAVLNCPYTVSDGGQMKFGGWHEGARETWREVREKCEQARQRDHVEEMEAACLERLRIKHKVAEHEAKKKKTKKRKYDVNGDDTEEDEFA
jgi:hypothetical protein